MLFVVTLPWTASFTHIMSLRPDNPQARWWGSSHQKDEGLGLQELSILPRVPQLIQETARMQVLSGVPSSSQACRKPAVGREAWS